MKQDQTDTQVTMWSESLLEGLYVAIAKPGTGAALKDLLNELKAKGYEENYLIEKVEEKVGTKAADRLKVMLGRKRARGKRKDRQSKVRNTQANNAVMKILLKIDKFLLKVFGK